MSNKKTNVKQPLSEKSKLIIAIIAVIVAAVIILSVALSAVLKKDNTTTPDADPGSSSLTISNGDFAYVTKDALKAGKNPYKAQDWTLYSYSSKNEDTGKVSLKLNEEENVISGIVDTSKWDKVTADGVNATNPLTHDEESESLDKKVYLLSANDANVGILSKSFTVTSGKAAKITVWVNASGLTKGSANIAIHTNSTTSLDIKRDSDKDDQLYAYQYNITGEGWQSFTFYILNRDSGTKYMYLSVSLGNIYTAEAASGTLFVDDISYENISINDFRLNGSEDKTTNYVFASTDTSAAENAVLENATTDSHVTFSTMTSKAYRQATVINGKEYSPFIEDDLTIYKLTNDGQYYNPVFLRLADANKFTVEEDFNHLDILHVTFWIRVEQVNKLANANVLLKKKVGTEWQTISGGSFTAITTSQNLTEDNCGWTQYHLYVQPDINATELTMEFYFGSEKGYDVASGLPAAEGSMYVTAPQYEMVKSTSSGSNTKTINLTGASSSSGSITNGTFSDLTTASNKPTNWYPVFAGSNALYKDGKGDVIPSTVDSTLAAIGSTGIERNSANAPLTDDGAKNVLKLENVLGTAQGYVSGSISLSAKSVYMISVLAKTGTANPYIYLINNAKSRDDENVVLAKIESKATTFADDNTFCQAVGDLGDGWVRYYMVVVTGKESVSARLALFNGDIKGEHPTVGTIYYDQATITSIGSYTLDKENDDATEYDVTFTATSGYGKFEDIEKMEFGNLAVSQPTTEQWKEIKKVEPADDNKDDDKPTTPDTTIDLGLLFGIISSVILVAALIVVFIIVLYRNKKRKNS